jgi:hypothetical protein
MATTTLLKKTSVPQAQNMYGTEFPSSTYCRSIKKYVINKDWAARSTWMAAFSVPYMYPACVTLSF